METDEKDQQMTDVFKALEDHGYDGNQYKYKLFDGKSIGQLIADGEYNPEHLTDLLYKCGVMEKAYSQLSAMGARLLPFRLNWERYFNDPHSLSRELRKIKEKIADGQDPKKAACEVFKEGNLRHERNIDGK